MSTGLNEHNTGIYHVQAYGRVDREGWKVEAPESGHHYEGDATMLSEVLQKEGYTTGYVGKWHVTYDPLLNGFDFNAGGTNKGMPKSYFSPYENAFLTDGPKGEFLTDRLANEAIGFIRENTDRPFFLCYAPYMVHYPNQAPKKDIALFDKREKEEGRASSVYAAMVYACDRAIGNVLDALEAEGLAHNTLVILTSDNGANGRTVSNDLLRGAKGTVYEGGIRVPTMACWPGVTTARSTDAIIDIIDWYPTILEAVGVCPSKYELDGESLLGIFNGDQDSVRDTLFMHVPVYNRMNKPEFPEPFFQTPATIAIKKKYKLAYHYEQGRELELYDIENDMGESRNIASDYPEIADRMLREIKIWLDDSDAKIPTPLAVNE